jgi:amino acid transporter
MTSHTPTQHNVSVALSRTLGIWEVTLLGVGALLGGGVFTLLGHAAGLAGGALIVAIILGAIISFLNLNAYVSLATTFPEAGGGYAWVRDGLGEAQGFFSGWFSWMAQSTACSLYAVSFGVFAGEFVFSLLGVQTGGISLGAWRLIFTVSVVLLFSMINYRGVALTGRLGGYISLAILAVLVLYIIFGLKKIFVVPGLFQANFSPFAPFGFVGIVQAAGLFYIAFEGSEIQAQTGEEARDPGRTLKISLFSSWAIITVLYFFISLVMIGATGDASAPSWRILGEHADRAMIESARQFLPFGYVLMVLGGIFANIAALNATIYSSSRVLFAMARDKSIWARLGEMHEWNQTPYRAILVSMAAIVAVALFLPLKDIAGAADILFIALFLQLNLAYIELRRKMPEAKWRYIIPFGPLLPLAAVTLYAVLGISLFHVSPVAIYLAAAWFLLGLVNYFGYTKTERRDEVQRETMYEHFARFREKIGYRVILPVASEEHWREFSEIGFAMARSEEGEVLAIRIHTVPPSLPLAAGFNTDHERGVLEKIERAAREYKLNIQTRLLAARSVSESILSTTVVDRGNLLLMGWDGYVNSKGFIFGRNVDVVLHRVKCDLLVVKFADLHNMKTIFIPAPLDENPNLRFTGKTAEALARWFGSSVTVGMIVPEDAAHTHYAQWQGILDERVRELKIAPDISVATKLIHSRFVASAIVKEAERHDIVLLPAARGRITKVIGMGSIPEQVAKHCGKTIIMARGHRGIIQPFFDYLASRF